jgi:hypothetical protein
MRVEMPLERSQPLEQRTLTMRRRTKPVPLARMDLNKLIRTLRQRSTSEWSRHLSSALEVLTVELKVDRHTALDLLIAAVSAAHRCACAVEQRALAQSRARAQADVGKALLRIAKCAARSPAELRCSLDLSVRSVLGRGIVDTEVLRRLVHRATQVFRKFRKMSPAATALKAMGFPDTPGQERIGLITNIEALHPTARGRAEQALSRRCRESPSNWTASGVFGVLATAVSSHSEDGASPEISDLLVEYVRKLGDGWTAVGLRPGRANHPGDANYKSRFHRFSDLVLTAFMEPSSLRHDGDLTEIRQKLRRSHLALPADWRGGVDAGLRLSDREWLISEDHLRRARIQKSAPETP